MFGEVATFEAGSGTDEGDEVGHVHGPPPRWADSTTSFAPDRENPPDSAGKPHRDHSLG